MRSGTKFELLREGLLRRLNIDPLPPKVSIFRLMHTEWSHEFERLMRNRMITGSLRYGPLNKTDEINKPRFDRVSDMKRRLDNYKDTGNLENLVDVANLCLCEFVEGDHPRRHFKSSDDAEHTKRRS